MRIPVVLLVGEAEVDLELDLADGGEGVTVADVIDAVLGGPGPEGGGPLVDGRPVPLAATLSAAGILAGSVLQWATADDAPPAAAGATIEVVGGLHAGDTFAVPAGPVVIGGAPGADLCLPDAALSGRHARLDVSGDGTVITDLHSHGGIAVNGVRIERSARVGDDDEVTLGSARLRVSPRAHAGSSAGRPHARTGTGRLVVHRHPRRDAQGMRTGRRHLPAPVPPGETSVAQALPRPPWAAILAPAVLGVVLAVTFGPTMAIFALLGPVMAVVSWLDERRRVRRDRRQHEHDREMALADFARAVDDAAAMARRDAVARHPDPAEVVRRADGHDPRLWERRPGDDDFLEVSVGAGDVPWSEAPHCQGGTHAASIVAARRTLAAVPVGVDLLAIRALGIAGRAAEAEAMARWVLLQIAAHHSPVDVRITVVGAGPARRDDWDWTKWLPHVEGPDDPRPAHEVVLVDGRSAPGEAAAIASRALRANAEAVVIVLADRAAALPSVCRATVEIHPGGRAVLRAGEVSRTVAADGVTRAAARRAARALAPLLDAGAAGSDPSQGQLPATVALDELLGGPATAAGIQQRWRRAGAVPRLAAAVGITADGPLVVDLGRDGPHGLVAGTTGSGKSEILRTLVAGLAANVDPEHLNLVLVDFKGGSAFAPVARLPHVTGFVTDLDEHLAARALRSLEAELRRRERLLRSAGAEDLRSYLEGGHATAEPLPALLVVIDEFATLAADLPGFVEALVDVAQRGRSLGIHLLLATQRPAGAIGGNLRANTNLRIALRLQDEADSLDVIGTAAAATVSRTAPGRGFARTGQGEIVAFQAATTAPRRRSSGGPGGPGTVTVRPFVLPSPLDRGPDDGVAGASTDAGRVDLLGPLVDAIVAAASSAGFTPPSPPWLEPLPQHLDLGELPAAAEGVVPLGLADDPDNQCRHLYGWHEAVGNVALIGDPARTGEALVTFGRSAARLRPADRLHIYGLDFGPGRLSALGDLPHTGSVIGAAERDRQERLIRMLAAEVDRRRADGLGAAPTILLLVDNYAAFHAAFDDLAGLPWRERLVRVFADGPALGVVTAVAADRPSALPPSAAAAFGERLLFRLADPLDAHLIGVAPRQVAALPAGRAVHVPSGLEVQFASAGASSDVPVPTAAAATDRVAPAVECLPHHIAPDALPSPRLDGVDWSVPVGLGDDLRPAILSVTPGEPVLVAGGPRSGRSSAVALVAESVRRARPDAVVHAVALRPSRLRSVDGVRCATTRAEVAHLLAEVTTDDGRPHLLLIDDAELVEDPAGVLQGLADTGATVALVAAGRSDVLRARFGHWTAAVRRSGVGLVLRPRPEVDGDLWQVPLPRSSTPFGPGRGYLVQHGDVGLVQLAELPPPLAMTRSCDLGSVESPQ